MLNFIMFISKTLLLFGHITRRRGYKGYIVVMKHNVALSLVRLDYPLSMICSAYI